MAVDAEILAAIGGEQMAEGGVALELRRADHAAARCPAPNTERPISIARPMLPIVGLESKVEQTL